MVDGDDVHDRLVRILRTAQGGLQRDHIDYDEVDIEHTPGAAELVMQLNGGNQTVPTVVFPDGTAMTNPSVQQVKEKLAAVSPDAWQTALVSPAWDGRHRRRPLRALDRRRTGGHGARWPLDGHGHAVDHGSERLRRGADRHRCGRSAAPRVTSASVDVLARRVPAPRARP